MQKYRIIYSIYFHAWTIWLLVDEYNAQKQAQFNTYEEAEHWIEERENEK